MKKQLIIFLSIFTIMHATDPDGTLDPTFGTNGFVITNIDSSVLTEGNGTAFQPDGKIVVAGNMDAGNISFLVIRYNSNGSLDESFGTNGVVTTEVGTSAKFRDVALQIDGKIVAIGENNSNGNDDWTVVRYNPDGSLDTSFGTGGIVITSITASADVPRGVAIQPNGKILVGGASGGFGASERVTIARYNIDGSLDTSFGTDGIATTAGPVGQQARGDDLLLQPDGKIVIVGFLSGGASILVVRFNADGTLDTSFGTEGFATTIVEGFSIHFGLGGRLQPDGKIIVAGLVASPTQPLIIRYNSDGSIDTSFGESGFVITTVGTNSFFERAILQPDGKIIGVGRATVDGTNLGLIIRYNTNGSLSTNFGTNGIIITDYGENSARLEGVNIQPDGKIVVAGFAETNTVVARYLVPSVVISPLARDIRAKYFLLNNPSIVTI